MRFAKLLLLSLGLLLGAQAASAATYQIELLVFLRNANPTSEYIPHGVAPPPHQRAVATLAAPGSAPQPIGGGVTLLPRNALSLTAEAEALRRQGMRPLLHTAWRQVVHGRKNGDWLWLNAGPVSGLIRISLGRYLHVNTYLGQNGRFEEAHRRMRSNELHYLDSPGYGILIQIKPASG